MSASPLLTQFPIYSELRTRAALLQDVSVAALFADETDRTEAFSTVAAGLHLDYSKQLLDRGAMQALLQLATQAGLPRAVGEMMAGEKINNTEQRAALHTLLRAREAAGLAKQFSEVRDARASMQAWADKLNRGEQRGFSGAVITDVVNIGIGGSDLGPRLVTDALRPFQGDVACHYVANVDPADLQDTLLEVNAQTTLFIICSKSFSTEETLTNALLAREWMRTAGASDADLDKHFLAITSNLQAAAEFGIPAENCLPMWDWVGGRYSVWSAIGLSCAIAVGWENFAAFLDGAAAMDQHVAEAPLCLLYTSDAADD
mgnify:FL=1